MDLTTRFRAQGFTALEFLIICSCIAVLAAFAVPASNYLTARMEMYSAVKNVTAMVNVARQSTQDFHTDVVLLLQTGPEIPNTLSYSARSVINPQRFREAEKKVYTLPESVRMKVKQENIHFDSDGNVGLPTQVVLFSTRDKSLVKHIQVE